MKQIIFSTVLLFTIQLLFAQNDSTTQTKKHVSSMATIRTTDGKSIKGWFYKMNDQQVVLLSSGKRNFKAGDNDNINIGVDQIRSISLRKKNSVLKGALLGMGIGATVGIIAGLASGDDEKQPYYDSNQDPFGLGNVFVSLNNAFAMTAGEKALAGGIGLGVSGAIIGTIIGAVAKKKFIIGGKKEVYRDLQGDLMKRLIVQ
jgi:hypothetical protein